MIHRKIVIRNHDLIKEPQTTARDNLKGQV